MSVHECVCVCVRWKYGLLLLRDGRAKQSNFELHAKNQVLSTLFIVYSTTSFSRIVSTHDASCLRPSTEMSRTTHISAWDPRSAIGSEALLVHVVYSLAVSCGNQTHFSSHRILCANNSARNLRNPLHNMRSAPIADFTNALRNLLNKIFNFSIVVITWMEFPC